MRYTDMAPRVQRLQAGGVRGDAMRARCEHAVASFGPDASLTLRASMLRELLDALTAAEQALAQAAPVLDDVMTTLDWVSTTTEGTPKQPFLEIHHRVGEQMRRVNAWRAAREG